MLSRIASWIRGYFAARRAARFRRRMIAAGQDPDRKTSRQEMRNMRQRLAKHEQRSERFRAMDQGKLGTRRNTA